MDESSEVVVTMVVEGAARRPSPAVRRFGYAVAAVINAVIWYLVNERPGWSAVPFLTAQTERVLTLFNVSLLVGLIANLVYMGYDGPRWKAFGDACVNVVSVAVLVRMWQVFPFSFSGWSGWPVLTRVLLAVALGGTAIAIIVGLGRLVRSFAVGAASIRHGR